MQKLNSVDMIQIELGDKMNKEFEFGLVQLHDVQHLCSFHLSYFRLTIQILPDSYLLSLFLSLYLISFHSFIDTLFAKSYHIIKS